MNFRIGKHLSYHELLHMDGESVLVIDKDHVIMPNIHRVEVKSMRLVDVGGQYWKLNEYKTNTSNIAVYKVEKLN